MMKKRILLIVSIVAIAGCTDDCNSVSREYRNANNECLDAMMMVTSETRAVQMTLRIFKPMTERYKLLDKKLDIMKINRLKKEFIKEVLESDGVHVYLKELRENDQRYILEMTRIRNLYDQYREKLRADGKDDSKMAEEYPGLSGIVGGQGVTKPLEDQLTRPKLFEYLKEFKGQVDPEIMKVYLKKQEVFKPVEHKLAF